MQEWLHGLWENQFFWLEKYDTLLLQGLWRTILLVVLSGAIGFAGAILVGLGRVSKNPLISTGCLGFTSIIRGTPLLVQIYLLYYGLGSVFAGMPALRQSFLWPFLREGFWYVVLALAVSTAAYTGEVVRAALLAVPKGEIEAGRAFGMSPGQIRRRIWLPRALQGDHADARRRDGAAAEGHGARLDGDRHRPARRRQRRARPDFPHLRAAALRRRRLLRADGDHREEPSPATRHASPGR